MRLADWPRMPYLNDELREWIAAHLATLGVEEIAIYAVDPQRGQDEERRVLVATEVGLIDGWYAPRGGSSARYGFTARVWPWQAVRGVDLRGETYRVWALEHRTRWWLRLTRPGFESETDSPELGAALCDFAKVCAVMAEPAGWQAAQDEVPVRREGLRVLPEPTEVPPEAGTDVEAITPTGRPAVPPPVVGPSLAPPEPTPLRPDAAFKVADAEPDAARELEPDILIDEFVHATPAQPGEAEGQEDTAQPFDEPTDASDSDATADPAVEEPPVEPAPAEESPSPESAEPDSAELAPDLTAPSTNGDRPADAADAEQPRLGLLAARREARRDREARERERDLERERDGAEAATRPAPGPDSREAAAAAASPPAATATLPQGEEPVDLTAYPPGEEPINLNEYDPDPLGLEGPLHDR